MTDSINQNQVQSSLASDLKTTAMFSAAFPAVGAVSSVVRNRGIKNAVAALELENFKKLNLTLKQNNTDIFTKGIKLSEQYDIVKNATKEAKKQARNLAKANKKGWDISKVEKFKEATSKADLAQKNLDTVNDALENGKLLTKNGGEILSVAANSTKGTMGKTVKNLFKSEMKNKFVLGITVLAALPRIKEDVIPAFKEKGVIEGIKATGKVIARTAADFVSNAGFSAVGRAVGTALGSVVPGAGNVVGGMLGDAIGSCISIRLTSKIFDKDKSKASSQISQAEQPTQTSQVEQPLQTPNPETVSKISTSNQTVWSGDSVLDGKINRALSI